MTQKKTTRKKTPSKRGAAKKTRSKKAIAQRVPKKKAVEPAPPKVIDLEEERRLQEASHAQLQETAKEPFKELQFTDGKKTDIEDIKDLEDLLGVKQANPFGTTNMEILEERMKEMGLSDLQAFAVKIGILPSGNKLSLKNKIKRQFKSHAGAGSAYHIGFQKPLVDPNGPEAAEILKILSEM